MTGTWAGDWAGCKLFHETHPSFHKGLHTSLLRDSWALTPHQIKSPLEQRFYLCLPCFLGSVAQCFR